MNNQGHAGFKRLAGALNRPSLLPKMYEEYAQCLYRRMEQHYEATMKCTQDAIRQYYTHMDTFPDASGLIDIDVTCDMSWMKHGHRSHLGIGTVNKADTRIILDFEVMCNLCNVRKAQRKIMKARFPDWYKSHKGKCQKNFDGTSAAMEAAAAVRLWEQSTHQFRYLMFIGDGDSNTYQSVCALNNNAGFYNEPVKKENCINYVGKRMGTRLWKMKKEHYTTFKTKKGETMKRSLLGGVNMLTDSVIDKLSSYCIKAIWDSNLRMNTETIKKAVWATYFHLSASKEEEHSLCPCGEDS